MIKSSYWFVTMYLLLYIFSPYLNTLLNNISKEDYKKLLFLQFLIFSVITTFTRTHMISNEFLWGLFLYSLGGYIRLHFKIKITKTKLTLYLLISLILTFLAIITLEFLSTYVSSLSGKEYLAFYDTQGFFPLISSVLIFLIFKQIDIGSISWINTIAPTMFSVYLIHDNFLVRPLLWHYVKSFTSSNPISILIVGFVAPLIILVLCSLIDLIRIQIVSLSIKLFKAIKKDSVES
ncbi:acyltransferase family protein [Latilactobacillus sakei]|uniref:acyltransferase family protein n=1 Tax=Latilactobacillus sakei TaxID=1599 RepID=UPI00388568AA